MIEPFEQVNSALRKEFGDGVVEMLPSDSDNYSYVLHFEEDRPSQSKIKRATQIVGATILTVWPWLEQQAIDDTSEL